MASLGGLSPSPFLWVSKVTLGTPAARLPRRFRHSRCWCLGRLRRVRWLVFFGLARPVWEGAWPRWASCLPVLSYGFRRCEAFEAFPSQQVLVFGPGDTASVGPAGWSSGLAKLVWASVAWRHRLRRARWLV